MGVVQADARSRELNLGLSCGWQGSRNLKHHLLSPRKLDFVVKAWTRNQTPGQGIQTSLNQIPTLQLLFQMVSYRKHFKESIKYMSNLIIVKSNLFVTKFQVKK